MSSATSSPMPRKVVLPIRKSPSPAPRIHPLRNQTQKSRDEIVATSPSNQHTSRTPMSTSRGTSPVVKKPRTPSSSPAGSTKSSDDGIFAKPIGVPKRSKDTASNLGLKKAASYHNIVKNKTSEALTKETRTRSTHNVATGKTESERQRISANSELLLRIEKEKKDYEARISELIQVTETRKIDSERLSFEVKNLKESLENSEQCCLEMREENQLLRRQLSDLGCEPENVTDTYKLTSRVTKRKKGANNDNGGDCSSHQEQHSSSSTPDHPSSLSDNIGSSNWDRQSIKSNKSDALSGISVANLQDRIHEMEEVNFTTVEELEATLLELTDSQRNIDDLNEEKTALGRERNLLLESLCEQTENLQHCRMQNEMLKFLLISDKSNERSEREEKLSELVQSVDVEKAALCLQTQELNLTVESLREDCKIDRTRYSDLKAKYDNLEGKHNELFLKNESSTIMIDELKRSSSEHLQELQRCRSQLEEERERIRLLESSKTTEDSDLQQMISRLREEKNQLASRIDSLTDEYSQSRVERDRAVAMESQLKLSHDKNAYLVEELQSERDILSKSNFELRKRLEQREQESVLLRDLQAQLEDLTLEKKKLLTNLYTTKEKLEKDSAEWDDHQKDLLIAVRVADEFKMEVIEELKSKVTEIQHLKERVEKLQEEVSLLNNQLQKISRTVGNSPTTELRDRMIHSVDRELVNMRTSGRLAGDAVASATVKSIIQNIEQQVKKVNSPGLVDASDPPSVKPDPFQSPVSSAAVNRRTSGGTLPTLTSTKAAVAPTPAVVTTPNTIVSKRTRGLIQMDKTPSPPAAAHLVRASSIATTSPADGRSTGGAVATSPMLTETGGSNKTKLVIKEESSSLIPPDPEEEPPAVSAKGRSSLGLDHSFRPGLKRSSTATNASPTSPMPPESSPLRTAPLSDDVKDASANLSPGVTSSLLSTGSGRRSAASVVSVVPTSPIPLVKDPLAELVKQTGGSKRNALLKWCQTKTNGYKGIDITNFSTSWTDGLAMCALLHTYLPQCVPYAQLAAGASLDKRRNLKIAFEAAESVGIGTTLSISEMVTVERPDWNAVMSYVTSIYTYFEVDST